MGERSEEGNGGFQVARIGHALNGLSLSDMKHILKYMAWRRAREGWREEARARPNLKIMWRLMECRCKARCVDIDCKRQRRML